LKSKLRSKRNDGSGWRTITRGYEHSLLINHQIAARAREKKEKIEKNWKMEIMRMETMALPIVLLSSLGYV
jgi:hypothetical protein